MTHLFLFLVLLITTITTQASDHIDGPVTTQHRVADLADFYVFSSPSKPGFTTLILNTYPLVPSNGHFDSKLSYRIHIRKLLPSSLEPLEDSEGSLTIECRFITPHDHHAESPHKNICQSSNGLRSTSVFNRVKAPSGPMSVFHGMRSDPFFFNSDFFTESISGKLPGPATSNTMEKLNVLSLVIEVDLKTAFPAHDLFGFYAEAIAENDPLAVATRLDRVGRPEMTNLSLFSSNGNQELRDAYNLEDSFDLSDRTRNIFKSRLSKNISHFDSIDGRVDWKGGALEKFVDLLSHDYLVYDISKPCLQDSFLEIERAHLSQSSYVGCGGRAPENDVMDRLYSLYIGGLGGAEIRDGITAPSRPLSKSFPYLAAPDLSASARLKAFVARKVLGL